MAAAARECLCKTEQYRTIGKESPGGAAGNMWKKNLTDMVQESTSVWKLYCLPHAKKQIGGKTGIKKPSGQHACLKMNSCHNPIAFLS